jgi:hypothetical protein
MCRRLLVVIAIVAICAASGCRAAKYTSPAAYAASRIK